MTLKKVRELVIQHRRYGYSLVVKSCLVQLCLFLMLCGLRVRRAESLDGNPWKAQSPSITSSYLNDVWAASPHHIFAVGMNINGAIVGRYDGQAWTNIEAYILGNPFSELNGIWGSSESDVYAVGGIFKSDMSMESLILHYDGFAWSLMETGFSGNLLDVWGNGPHDVFAVGEEGLIIHWDGNSWQLMDSPSTADLNGVWGDGLGMMFAVGIDTILMRQNDVWVSVPDLPPVYLYDVWGVPGGDVWAVGSSILQYHNGQWQEVNTDDLSSEAWLYKIVGRSEQDIMAVGSADMMGEEGLILRYDGAAWQVEEGSFPGYLNGAWLGQEGEAIVVGGKFLYEFTTLGIILTFDGSSWTFESGESYEGTLFQVWANSSQDMYAVGGHPDPPIDALSRSYIAHYDGLSWSQVAGAEYGVLLDIWGSPQGELFAVGGDRYISFDGEVTESLILHSHDGSSWESMGLDFEDVLQGVWGSSGDDVFAVGENGIYHFNGNIWAKMPSPTMGLLRGIWGVDSSHIFVVGDQEGWDGKAALLSYDGVIWTAMDHEIYDNLGRVWGTAPDDVFAAGEAGIYHYDGQTWSLMDCPIEGRFFDVWGTSPVNVYASGDYGIVRYNGQEWVDTGFTSAIYNPVYGLGGASTDDVVAVGDFGTVFHYENTETCRQKILLRKGWNLISFQVNVCFYDDQQATTEVNFIEGVEFHPVDDLKTWLLDGENSPIRDAQNPELAGNWQRITSFDQNGSHMLDKNLPSQVNDLVYLAAGYGYWIKMNEPGYLVLSGEMITLPASQPLRKGWNLVGVMSPESCYYDTDKIPSGIPSEIPQAVFVSVPKPVVESAFPSISGSYRRVIGFDSTGSKFYDTQLPSQVCDLHYIAPGCGYWIKMDEAGELAFP